MPDFVEALNELRVPFRRGASESEFNICCPFCIDRGETADTRFRLGVNVKTLYGNCFNCQWRSREAPKWILWKLGSHDPLSPTVAVKEEGPKKKVVLPEDFEPLWKIKPYDRPAYYAKRYLLKRGFTVEDMKEYGFGVSLVGTYGYRIIMPVRWRTKLKGLVCRDFTGRALAKYLNNKGDKYLWNLPAFIKYRDLLVLSEGIFKAIAIRKALGVHSAALLGRSITPQQLKQLKFAKAKRILVWPDPDRPGIKGLVSVADTLIGEGYEVSTLWPPPKKQADEYKSETLKKLVARRQKKYDWGLQTKIEACLSFGSEDAT